MKVYIKYPWKVLDSSYYKYLTEFPPEGINFVKPKSGIIQTNSEFVSNNRMKSIIRKASEMLRLPIPNVHLTIIQQKYDLIHAAHCLSLNKSPWVADVEALWNFWLSGQNTKLGKLFVKKILTSNNCKSILTWTENTKREILKEFPEIKNKTQVVYPAIPEQKFRKQENEKITILYATRYFWLKGGLISLEVYRELKKKYGDKVELIFISDVPEYVKREYPEIDIIDLVPQDKLYEYYRKSDVFFYPSFMDTFGFGLIEAMSFGLPTVSVNTYQTKTRNEIIENNKTGIIFDINDKLTDNVLNMKEITNIGSKEQIIINKLVSNCSRLIEDEKFRKELSRNCINEIKNGKFSINQRNKKLKRIYEEAIR